MDDTKQVYCTLRVDGENLYWTWTEASEHASESEMKKCFYEFVKLTVASKVKNIIIDERKLAFNYDPNFQDWVDQDIAPRVIATGVARFAVVKSSDFIVELAAKQIFDEPSASNFQIKFFDTPEDAQHWANASL